MDITLMNLFFLSAHFIVKTQKNAYKTCTDEDWKKISYFFFLVFVFLFRQLSCFSKP